MSGAVDRGVDVTMLLERHTDDPRFDGPDDPFSGLPATRLCWPATALTPGAAMHAKVIVVDSTVALVGAPTSRGPPSNATSNAVCSFEVDRCRWLFVTISLP